MEMVAAAKLRRFQDFLDSAKPYTERLGAVLDALMEEPPKGYEHPFLQKSSTGEEAPKKRRIALVLFTSDTGLCGTYNSDLEGRARTWIQEKTDCEISFVFVGKHGANFFQKEKTRTLASLGDLRVSRVDEILEELTKILAAAFTGSRIDEVHLLYMEMESLARYHARHLTLLPFSRKEKAEEKKSTVTYLIEPDSTAVLNRLIPMVFQAQLRFIFYHALLTEQIARMAAMRQATQNAKEMIDELTLLRNKARQASITKEIIEIVSGSRALKLK